ncbi:hemolysin family protein [bacterium]|nr:hemolysin family protein [bacterium]
MLLLYTEISLILFLLFLSGFFSGSETALFSLTRVQIEKMVLSKEERGKNIKRLLERPRRLIITILLGNEFVNISISSISAAIIIGFLGEELPWINIVIVLPVLLLFGEITPKTLAIRKKESFALFVANPLYLFSRIVAPLLWLIRTISDRVVNLFVRESSRTGSILTEDVIKTIVEEGEKEGIIDSLEREYIYNVFDFGDARMDDVMTPRVNMFYLPEEMSLNEMIGEIKKHHFSKVPIYRENRDNIVGVLFANDLLELGADQITQSAKTLQKILRQPYFVPVTKRADELFQTFQHRKISVAIVLDEYGGVQGMVSMEDLLEAIFGDITDEFEDDSDQHEKLGESLFRVNANMSVDEFNELLDVELLSDDVDTVGGFVFALFGEMPKVKSSIKYESIVFTVEKIVSNRIDSLLVKKI